MSYPGYASIYNSFHGSRLAKYHDNRAESGIVCLFDNHSALLLDSWLRIQTSPSFWRDICRQTTVVFSIVWNEKQKPKVTTTPALERPDISMSHSGLIYDLCLSVDGGILPSRASGAPILTRPTDTLEQLHIY